MPVPTVGSPQSSHSTFKLEDFEGATQNGSFDFHAEHDMISGDDDDVDHEMPINPTNYSSRLEEILDDDDDDAGEHFGDESDGEIENSFLYTGADAPQIEGYDAQLADMLGSDAGDGHSPTAIENAEEEKEVFDQLEIRSDEDEVFEYPAFHGEVLSDKSPPSHPGSIPPTFARPLVLESPSRLLRPPFLHPTVSRLRSFAPQHQSRVASSSTVQSFRTKGLSPDPSHFSAISGASSTSNNQEPINGRGGQSPQDPFAALTSPASVPEREVFRWTTLRHLSAQLYFPSSKAAAVLDTHMGRPTCIVANGLVGVGTDTGRTFVFDFRQQLKCVCGSDAIVSEAGPVTALALSLDHTFLAVGHLQGHIYLYDLAHSQAPARTVTPVDMASVAVGRKEGHLLGSKIIHVGFVGARHTALVSADDVGLAFYYSLGKVLFVEATDVLRILGNYPDEGSLSPARTPPTSGSREEDAIAPETEAVDPNVPERLIPPRPTFLPISGIRRNRKTGTILAMAPLPIASSSHPTDFFNVVSILTPIKLIVVGMKPAPRTWYRRHRGGQDGDGPRSLVRGCMAWFPSVSLSKIEENTSPKSKPDSSGSTEPLLVYSWGRSLSLLRVRADKLTDVVKSSSWKIKDGKSQTSQTHRLVFDDVRECVAQADIMALRWLHVNQLLVVTVVSFDVYDTRTFAVIESVAMDVASYGSSLSIHKIGAWFRQPTVADPGDSLSPSVDVYKGKIFMLGREVVQVGTLLSWADRILSYVQNGDFLSAIDIARAYYVGEAPGNKMGLPENDDAMHEVVGQKLRDLMLASARYTFSDDRLTDATHQTPDGRGVDRTSLFEQMVPTTARACVALDDFDFLFDDLFDMYISHGIGPIYLLQLEPLLLDGELRIVPPRITQQLIEYHASRQDYAIAERVIWHIDPTCLDINQAIRLCQEHSLYDALIYVYNRALRDYVSPMVELLGLVRKVQQTRREWPSRIETSELPAFDSHLLEELTHNAYKIYPYLGDVLCGLTHPTQDPMPPEQSYEAKSNVYLFLFSGRSSLWQGRLVLTSEEEGGPEPTYPYLRVLTRFDAEAMLHVLDLAFEDSYLNDSDHSISRQHIVDSLLEFIQSDGLTTSDVTFLRIFIARNVPKYPQFIHLSVNHLRSILQGLASDNDQSTREDRQLAVECVLSMYTLRGDEQLLQLFEQAGFFRILRAWNRQERHWGPLISTYLRDPDLPANIIFSDIDDALNTAKDDTILSTPDLSDILSEFIPSLLQAGLSETAELLDHHFPTLHERALEELQAHAPSKEFFYLRRLIQPGLGVDELDDSVAFPRSSSPSQNLSPQARSRFVDLMCKNDRRGLLPALQSLKGYFDLEELATICEEGRVYDALLWSIDQRGELQRVFDMVDSINESQAPIVARSLVLGDGDAETLPLEDIMDELSVMSKEATRICQDHSHDIDLPEGLPADEMWFRLLRSQIGIVQAVSEVLSSQDQSKPFDVSPLERLRVLVQDTFTSLVQQSSSRNLSFPKLFKRLVDASSSGRYAHKTMYTEFRLILGGMLDSYRSEGDFLVITNRLVERDLFESVQEYTAARKRGKRMALT